MCYYGSMGVEQTLNATHLQHLQTLKVFIWELFSQLREEGGAHLPYYQVQSRWSTFTLLSSSIKVEHIYPIIKFNP